MFIVELQPKTNNKQIYEIKSLMHCRIILEPLRPKRDIPQCAMCNVQIASNMVTQKRTAGVSQNASSAGDHASINCTRKSRSENVKCVLCMGNHPANYKGCTVYKSLQKLKYLPLKNKQAMTAHKENMNAETLIHHQTISPETTYAQTTTKKREEPNKSPQDDNASQFDSKPNEMRELMDMLKQIM